MKRDRNGYLVKGSTPFGTWKEPPGVLASVFSAAAADAKAGVLWSTVNYERAKAKALGETLARAKKDLERVLNRPHSAARIEREREVIQNISDLLIDSLSKLAMIDLKQHM